MKKRAKYVRADQAVFPFLVSTTASSGESIGSPAAGAGLQSTLSPASLAGASVTEPQAAIHVPDGPLKPTVAPLPDHFRLDGAHLVVLRREGSVILVEKTPGITKSTHEIAVPKDRSAELEYGRPQPAAQGYPSPEEWGRCAWSYNNIEDAAARFEEQVALHSPEAPNTT